MGALVPTKRIITIEISESNGINVFEDGRSTGTLCWDEMLGHVAAMTIGPCRAKKSGLFSMKTAFEWAELERRSAQRYREMEAERDKAQ